MAEQFQGQIHIKTAVLFITKGALSYLSLSRMGMTINSSSLLLREATADSKELPVYTNMAKQLMGGLQPSLYSICLLMLIALFAGCHCCVLLPSLLVSMTFFTQLS